MTAKKEDFPVIDFAALAAPYKPEEIDWRVDSSGVGDRGPWAKVLAYQDTRAIEDRLDTVITPGGWQTEIKYIETSYPDKNTGISGGFICGLSIKVDGEWVTKWDGAALTEYQAFKGGITGSIKRAAVQWGMGRYLYGLKDEPQMWAVITENGKYKDKIGGDYYKWDAPQLPAWALPEGYKPGKPTKKASAPKTEAPAKAPQQDAPPVQSTGGEDGLCPEAVNLRSVIMELADRGEGSFSDLLAKYTAFTGKDGNEVAGKRDIMHMAQNGKWCRITASKAKKDLDALGYPEKQPTPKPMSTEPEQSLGDLMDRANEAPEDMSPPAYTEDDLPF